MVSKEKNNKQENNSGSKTEKCWDYKSFSARMSARLEKVRHMLHGEEGAPSFQKDKELYHA